jgi:hypothetical protein
LSRARAAGASAQEALAGHDSYSFFAAIDDLLITGPSHTNVNDFRAVLIDSLRRQKRGSYFVMTTSWGGPLPCLVPVSE